MGESRVAFLSILKAQTELGQASLGSWCPAATPSHISCRSRPRLLPAAPLHT